MGKAKERLNYDRQALKAALRKRYPNSQAIADIIGKSRSWVNAVISPSTKEQDRGNGVAGWNDLKLLCALAQIEVEDILLPDEPEEAVEEAKPVSAPTATPVQATPQVVIQQNITITDEQYQWIKDAYAQLRIGEKRRHDELLTQIANCGRILVELLNATKKGTHETEQVQRNETVS